MIPDFCHTGILEALQTLPGTAFAHISCIELAFTSRTIDGGTIDLVLGLSEKGGQWHMEVLPSTEPTTSFSFRRFMLNGITQDLTRLNRVPDGLPDDIRRLAQLQDLVYKLIDPWRIC